MERKSGSTAVVTATEIAVALTRSNTVTAEEEKALRMRHGSTVDLNAPLARAAAGNQELGDELLLIEMQLLKAMKRQQTVAQATVLKNPLKDKIVRALRKKEVVASFKHPSRGPGGRQPGAMKAPQRPAEPPSGRHRHAGRWRCAPEAIDRWPGFSRSLR